VIEWRDVLSLLALGLVPLLAAFLLWTERRRRRDLERFVAAPLLGTVVPGLASEPRRLRGGVLLLAVAALVVAIAGPLWGFRWEEVRREGIDLVIALDTSRSMLATDVKPNRLARAKLALRDVLGELDGDRVALVAFAGTAFVQCPLTLDYGVFTEALDALDVDIIPLGGTAVSTAIDTALSAFEGRQGKHQAILLITDGEDHAGTAVDAAKRAQERGVKVYTVGIGTPDGELIPVAGGGFLKDRAGNVVKSRLDETTLQNVAVESGGVYVRASGPSLGLPDLYRDYVATMEKRELGSTLERRWEHRYQIPLLLAFAALLVEAYLGGRPRRRGDRGRWPARVLPVALAVLVAAPARAAWLDRDALPREAARRYAADDFEAAAAKYNESLIDEPDRGSLHYNLGAAEYRRGEWEAATRAFSAVLADDPEGPLAGRAAYNLGNVRFRQGEGVAGTDPAAALSHWGEALVAYRLAMNAAPDFEDPKYNYELVQRKIDELREQQEEQEQQQQEEQEQEEQEQQEQQEQEQQEQQEQQEEQEQQQGEQEQPDEQPEQPPQPEQPQESEGQERPEQEAAPEPRPGTQRMTEDEARALLDAGQDEELTPEEMNRGAVAAGDVPLKDW
jgi:Ca-activated chloride channel family protein